MVRKIFVNGSVLAGSEIGEVMGCFRMKPSCAWSFLKILINDLGVNRYNESICE